MDETTFEHQEILRTESAGRTQPSVSGDDCLLFECASAVTDKK